MYEANANRAVIALGPSIPMHVFAIVLSRDPQTGRRPRLTVGVDLSQLDPGYWHEVNPEELADAAERGEAAPFDAPFIIPKQSISIPHTPGLERMRRCSAIREPAPLGICITLSCPLNDELDLD
ncbi:hypothetical protein [Mesorhizobium sophorae]|uniref:hypothetical protein n=1 Tax=Mesorhizobium sophorae TaxID=1300294 RepID=UPI00117FB75E|nr:hypothetical protein [Mesorhizobium sophorae]